MGRVQDRGGVEAEIPDAELKPLLLDACRRWEVPIEHAAALLELRDTEAVKFVRGLPATTPSALLIGEVGTGKTVAACSALLDHFKLVHPFHMKPGDMAPIIRPRSAFFASMSDLAALSLWDKVDRSTSRYATEVELLILDDLGMERGDGQAIVPAILSDRFANKRRTLLTTNLSAKEFADRYGLRTIDRLDAAGAVFRALGPSLRGPK